MAEELNDHNTMVEIVVDKSEEFINPKSKSRKRKRDIALVDEDTPMDTLSAKSLRPNLPPIVGENLMGIRGETRKIPIPANRHTPLKVNWKTIVTTVVEQLHLQIRHDLKTKVVEIRVCKETTDIGALQKAADFIKAFALGFDVSDALALIRLDDLYLDSFDITDVKPLKGDHLARAIGRIAGQGGKTRFTIENVTKTRIVLADTKVHLLGSVANTKVAKLAICNLILGNPPSKVYGHMRIVASRALERF